MFFCPIRQLISALADRQGAFSPKLHRTPNLHGRGHGMEHGVIFLSQNAECPSRCFVCDHFTQIQNDEPVRHWDHIFQPMLTNQDGSPKLPVDAAKGLQEVCCCNGVQLAGGLVQDQHLRLQNHDGGQIQKLFLTAGELGHFHVKPGLDSEEACHFSNPPPYGR